MMPRRRRPRHPCRSRTSRGTGAVPGVMLRVIAALAVCLAATGCGADEKRAGGSVPFAEHGLTVALPPGWSAAARSLTPELSDPREVLAVATYPLRYRPTACAHVAGSALRDLGPDDAFVTLQERGVDPGSQWPDFPERPPHFGPQLGGPSEASACVPG